MDISKAKEIVGALAEGIDPITGEILPADHLCNNVDVVRAFYALLQGNDEKKEKTYENLALCDVVITGKSGILTKEDAKVKGVVITSEPTGSFRETYTPGINLIWSIVKLAIFFMCVSSLYKFIFIIQQHPAFCN